MKQENNKWILKQRVGGKVVTKAKGLATINAGQSYKARIEFDGATFTVFIDDQLLITMPKSPGSTPAGTIGFQAKKTAGTFGYALADIL